MTVGSVSLVTSVLITIDVSLRLSQQKMEQTNASKFVLTAIMVTSIQRQAPRQAPRQALRQAQQQAQRRVHPAVTLI